MEDFVKISIITVCFNEEKNIKATINSVLRQKSTDYEYIICDGKSTDKTVEFAESYRSKFEKLGINYTIKSERDGGIYCGMNNGIDLATGDYVIFMNAGDCFHGEYAITNIVDSLEVSNLPDVIYGDATYVERGFYKIWRAGNISKINNGLPFCHQSCLVLTDLIKNNKFDTSFKICADYDMLAKFYIEKKKFLYVNIVISDFYFGGISSVNHKETGKERAFICEKYNFEFNEKKDKIRIIRNVLIAKLKKIIPNILWRFLCIYIRHWSPAIELNNEINN